MDTIALEEIGHPGAIDVIGLQRLLGIESVMRAI
jgi:hypothetical protein